MKKTTIILIGVGVGIGACVAGSALFIKRVGDKLISLSSGNGSKNKCTIDVQDDVVTNSRKSSGDETYTDELEKGNFSIALERGCSKCAECTDENCCLSNAII